MKYLIFTLLFATFLFSCTDESKFPNELEYELENGGFVRFENLESFTAIVDFTNFTTDFTETRQIEDPNSNLTSVSYDLIANVGGSEIIAENVMSSSTFPFSFTVSQVILEDMLELDSGTLIAGDSFSFRAKATRNDGVVFNTTPLRYFNNVEIDSVGNLVNRLSGGVVLAAGTFDSSNLHSNNTYTEGNTQSNLYSSSYGNAMNFTISIACPFLASEAEGTYLITNDPFVTSLDYSIPIEAVANETGDGVVFKDLFKHLEPGTGNTYDVEFIFSDPTLGLVTIARQPAWHCDNFGCGYGEGRVDGSGSFFTCVGLVNVDLQHTVDLGSFGTFNLKLQKQ